jgi:hypothetical protein
MENKMNKLIFILIALLIGISPVFGQGGIKDPAWFEDDATDLDNIYGKVDAEIATIDTELGALDAVADTILTQARRTVTKAALLPPQTSTDTIFVGTGSVEILDIQGEITTAIGAVANATKLKILQGATTTDLCATVELNAAADKSLLTITGTFANAMVINTADTPIAGAQAGAIRVSDDTTWYLILDCAGSSGTGAIQWSVTYEPRAQGGRLVAD